MIGGVGWRHPLASLVSPVLRAAKTVVGKNAVVRRMLLPAPIEASDTIWTQLMSDSMDIRESVASLSYVQGLFPLVMAFSVHFLPLFATFFCFISSFCCCIYAHITT